MTAPREMLNTLVEWCVLGWMASHTVAWATVEMLRLLRATHLKIKRLWKSTEVEE